MNRQIKIHFVCRANVHRSRLAEAYTRSIVGSDWQVSSSGIVATNYPADFLSPWTKILANEHQLTVFLSSDRTLTTDEVLGSQDIIVFMGQDVFEDTCTTINFNHAKSVVWRIKDRENWSSKLSLADKRQKTFRSIKWHVDKLIKHVQQGGWVDIVDDNNRELGFSLPIHIANINKAWHRTCHAVLTTPDGKTLIQKRARKIMFSPGLIDVSLGGHLDMSEAPDEAVRREIEEETGIKVGAKDLRFLKVYKTSHYHPRYRTHTNSFIYSYHVLVTDYRPKITVQKVEVMAEKFVSKTQLKRLIRKYRLKGFGRLNYAHAYYKDMLSLAGII